MIEQQMLIIEEQILQFIREVYTLFHWPGVVVLMAIESAGIPLPSEIIMPLAGWMLIKEPGLSPWFLVAAGLYGALGNTLGSLLAYWIGLKGGRPALEKYGKFILISHHDLEQGDRWFAKYGSATAFFSRLMPAVRTFISFPAGIARMSLTKFLVYTFLGSFPWSIALAYGGYIMGIHWEEIRTVMRPFDIPILAALVFAAGYYFYRRWKRDFAETAQP